MRVTLVQPFGIHLHLCDHKPPLYYRCSFCRRGRVRGRPSLLLLLSLLLLERTSGVGQRFDNEIVDGCPASTVDRQLGGSGHQLAPQGWIKPDDHLDAITLCCFGLRHSLILSPSAGRSGRKSTGGDAARGSAASLPAGPFPKTGAAISDSTLAVKN